MNTTERLKQFYDFDAELLDTIKTTASLQNSKSFDELIDEYGLSDGPQNVRPFYDKRTVEYIDLIPKADYDERATNVYFAPMGTPVDESMAMRAMRLFGVQPDEKLRIVGSPALVGNPYNRLQAKNLLATWNGSLVSPVEPALRMLEIEGVTNIKTLGYSYGADIAAAAAGEAYYYGLNVRRGVWAEPAAVANRGLIKLLKDFQNSETPLAEYIVAANSVPLVEARERADHGFVRYAGGLARASNLAIAHALSKNGFEARAQQALRSQTDLQPTIAWGSASELTAATNMESIVDRLNDFTATNQVSGMKLAGMHHAGGDDIDLHAAIMRQGLKN